jgi:hypothetical protein
MRPRSLARDRRLPLLGNLSSAPRPALTAALPLERSRRSPDEPLRLVAASTQDRKPWAACSSTSTLPLPDSMGNVRARRQRRRPSHYHIDRPALLIHAYCGSGSLRGRSALRPAAFGPGLWTASGESQVSGAGRWPVLRSCPGCSRADAARVRARAGEVATLATGVGPARATLGNPRIADCEVDGMSYPSRHLPEQTAGRANSLGC